MLVVDLADSIGFWWWPPNPAKPLTLQKLAWMQWMRVHQNMGEV